MKIDQEDEYIGMMPKSWVILRNIFLSHKERESMCDKNDYRDPG